MNKRVLSPSLFHKTARTGKRQTIVNLIHESNADITRQEIAAAVDSGTNCVSVMMHQINKELELVGQGWKISPINIERQSDSAARPLGRRERSTAKEP